MAENRNCHQQNGAYPFYLEVDPYRKITKKFIMKVDSKVINTHFFFSIMNTLKKGTF
jgi:hypothetical protein